MKYDARFLRNQTLGFKRQPRDIFQQRCAPNVPQVARRLQRGEVVRRVETVELGPSGEEDLHERLVTILSGVP